MIKSTRRNRRSAFTGFLCNNAMVGVQSSVLTNVSAGGSRSAHVLCMQPETLLLEDRVMPVVNLSVKNVAVVEGDVQTSPSFAKFTVTRDGDTSQPFTFKFKTEAGTAKPGIDYIEKEGTQTIEKDDFSAEVQIQIIGNNKYQSDRKFSLAVWDENQTTGQDITFGDVKYWQNTKVNWTDQMAFGDLNGDGNNEIIVQQMWAEDGSTTGISDLGQLSIYDTQSETPEFPIDVMLNKDATSSVKVNSLQVVKLDNSSKYADIVIGTSDSVVIFRGKQSLTQLGTGKQVIPLTGGANKVIAQDFDNDGVAELVVVNNNGAYMFKAAVNGVYSVTDTLYAGRVSDVIANDFNYDGWKDVVLMKETWAGTTYQSSFIDGSYINDTNGKLIYTKLAPLASGTIPTSYQFTKISTDPATIGLAIDCSMTSQDFNGDGFADLAINQTSATNQTSNLFILAGSVTGGLESKGYLKTLSDSRGQIGSGDFNGDGFQDIAVSSPAGILFGTGKNDFSFTDRTQFQDLKADTGLTVTYSGGSSSLASNRLAVYDWNKDGLPDVLTNEKAMNATLNNGIWSFKANPSAAGATSIYYSSSTLTPTVPQFVKGETEGIGFRVNDVDLNNDGIPDLTSNTPNTIFKLLGSPNPVYSKSGYSTIARDSIMTPLGGVTPDFGNTVFADMNNDLMLDIVTRFTIGPDNYYAIYNYDSETDTYKLSRQTKTAGPGTDILVADFNGDNRNDIAYTNTTPGVSGVYFCFATGYDDFTRETLVPLSAGTMKQTFIRDLNDNGIMDVVYYGDRGIQVIFDGNKDNVSPLVSVSFDTPIDVKNFRQNRLTEISEDRTQDLVGLFNGQVVTYPLNSDGSIGNGVNYATSDGSPVRGTAVDFADFNNDGMDDFLVFNPASSMKFLQGRLDGTYDVKASPRKGPTGVNDHFIRDLNGDGRLDLVYATNAPDDYMFIFNVSAQGIVGEATIQDDDAPANVVVSDGNDQVSGIDLAFSKPLTVTVTNSNGNPVSGVPVTFQYVADATLATATFANSVVLTSDTNGLATSSTLTAGAIPGTFQVLATATGNAKTATASFDETIIPLIQYSISDQTVKELDNGTKSMVFTVNRGWSTNLNTPSSVIPYASAVNYSTRDLTAIAGVDYTAAAGLIEFKTDELSQTFEIPIIGNNKLQGNRIFQIQLTNPSVDPSVPTLAIAPAPANLANVTILDDDAPKEVVVDNGDAQSTSVGLAYAEQLSVIVKNAAGTPVSGVPVTYHVVLDASKATAGFAISNDQYSDANGRVVSTTLTAGPTPGTFKVSVSAYGYDSQTGTTLQAGTTFSETIVHPVQIDLSVSDISIVEGDTGTKDAVFTVTRSGNAELNNVTFRVSYTTQDGAGATGGKAGLDYVTTTGYLDFAAGELTKTVSVPVIGNNRFETDRTFHLVLSDAKQVTGRNIQIGDVNYWQNTKINWTDQMAFGDLNGDGSDERIVQQLWARDQDRNGITDLRQLSIYDTQSTTPEFPIDVMLLNNDLITPLKVNSLQVINLDKSVKDEGGVDFADIVIGTSDSVVIFRGKPSLTQLGTGKQVIPVTGGANKVIAQDFDNDGVAELVVVNNNGAFMLKAVNGVYSVTDTLYTGRVSDVIANDFNYDGWKDVVLMKETWAGTTYQSSFIDGSYINDKTGKLNFTSLASQGGTIPSRYQFTRISKDPVTNGGLATIGLAIDCSMTSQDFNGDGFADLAINQTTATNQTSNLFILAGSATGGLQSKGYLSTLSDSRGQIGSGDFNGDGFQDIAVSSPAGILFGTGRNDFSFTDRTQFQDLKADTGLSVTYSGGSSSQASNRLAVYDWNKDGLPDVLTNEKAMNPVWDNTNSIWTFKANPSAAGATSIYYSSSTLTPTVPQFVKSETEGTGFWANVVDLNNDGILDLTSNTRDTIYKLLGAPNPVYSKSGASTIPNATINTPVGGVMPDLGNTVFADMNNDLMLDIISRIQLGADNYYAIYNYDRPTDTYKLSRQTKTAGPGTDILVADFNGDKRNDIAYTTPGVSGVYFCSATRVDDFTRETLVPLSAGAMRQTFILDLNNNGKMDVVYYGTTGVQVVFDGEKGTVSPLVPISFGSPIVVGDFGHDGTQDLVGLINNQVVTYPLRSDGSIGNVVTHATRDGSTVIGTAVDFGDFNNDGIDDFLVFNPTTSMKFLQGRLDGTYDIQASPRKGPSGVHDHFIRDLNGDGKLDLVYATNAPDDYMFIFNVSADWKPEFNILKSGEALIQDDDTPTSIQIVQGDNQFAHLNSYYKDSLSVLVKNINGTPVSGVSVKFQTKTGTLGSDASFDSLSSVMSKSDGTAQASGLKANNLPGQFEVIATAGSASNAPTVTFTETININIDYQYSSNSIAEGDFGTTNLVFTVTRSGDISYASSVDYMTNDGTAIAGVDYDAVSGTIQFAAGEDTQTILVPIRGNTRLQSDRQFQVLLSNGSVDPTIPAVITLPVNIAVGTINDDDAPKQLVINDGNQQISGIGLPYRKPLSVIVKNAAGNPVSGVPVTFQYVADTTLATATFANSVVQTSDANGLATSSTLTAGPIPGTFQVLATATGNGRTATVNFNETIIPLIQYSISDATVAEGDNGSKMMVFTVNRGWSTTLNTPSPVIPYASAVNYLSKNLTAIAGVDYEAVSGSLQFAAGELTKTFEIPIIGNNKLQVDRKFQIQLTTPTVDPSVPTLAIAPAPANLATVTILDDDAPNQVVIDGGDQQISGIGLAYRKPLSVIVKNAAGTPVSGVPVTFRFVADATLATATFANSVVQTSDANGLATSSTLTAGPIPGTFQVLATATGNGKTATVNFNETIIPLIQYSISDATVAEGDNGSKMMVFTVNRGWSTTLNTPSPVIPYASAVNYLSKNLTAIAGVDYEAVSGNLQFAEGESTKTFEIPIIGNNKLQVDRKFQIQLTSPTVDPSVPTLAIAPTNPATVTILDDDAPKQVLVDSGDQQISGIGLAFRNPASSVVLNAAGTPVSGVSVTFRIVTDATKATASFANSTTLISDSNGRVTSSTFTAGPVPGTFQIDATASGNGQTANVRFNETIIPLIQYSISDSTVQEGDYGSNVMQFTVSRVWSTLVNTPSSSIPYASSVDYSTKDGTGLSGVDYQSVSGTLQFQAGEMTKIVQIQINGNTRLQADRLFQFQLSKPTIDPSVPTLISAPVSTVNCLIKDDDAPKSFTVESGNDQTVGIGQDYPKPVSVIVLNQAGNPVSGSSVSFKVVDGPTTATAKFANANTLIADSNGRAISSQLTAGQTPGQFQVVATASGNGQSATVNINETIIPLIQYLISDATVQEGDTGTKLMVYTVTRGGSTNLSTSIDFATSDGTGLAGADYVNTSGTLTFAANESVKKISIPVISNTIFQSDRSFNLTLSNPAWITGQPIVFQTPSPVATGKIMDDDNPQFISIVSGDQQSVILGSDYPNALSVKVQNLNGSVVSGVPINFEVRPGLGNVTASFANSATVISDSNGLAVASKLTAGVTPGSFMVYATANGYLSSKTAVFQLTQRGTITYSMADSSVKEGTSGLTPMVFTVTRTGTTWLDSSIDFKTINGTALAGVDYEASSGRIYFAPNELSKTIKVNVIGNTTPQADRKFSVAISLPSGTNPQPIDLIFPAAASQGTILDDDVSTGITPRSIPTPTPTPSPTPTPTPAPQTVLQSYAIQKGATGRSFVRYVDLVLNDLSTAANVVSSIASSAPRIRLTNKGLSGTSNSPVSLQGFAKSIGTSVNIDFGTKGLGGSPTTRTADGSYLLEMDLDANGSYETSMRFHRLLGDVNGDKVVNSKDTSLANSSLNKSGFNLPADTNGDGKVNATDVAYIKKAQKRKILI